MGSCPDQSCHETVQNIKKCQEDIKKELPNKVSKGTVKWGVGILVVIMLAVSGAWGKTLVDTNKRVNKIETDSAVQTERYQQILNVLKELKENQITVEKIHEEITKRIRRNRSTNLSPE